MVATWANDMDCSVMDGQTKKTKKKNMQTYSHKTTGSENNNNKLKKKEKETAANL